MTLALCLGLILSGIGAIAWLRHIFGKAARQEAELKSLKNSVKEEEIERKTYSDKLQKIDQETSIIDPSGNITSFDASNILSGKFPKHSKNP